MAIEMNVMTHGVVFKPLYEKQEYLILEVVVAALDDDNQQTDMALQLWMHRGFIEKNDNAAIREFWLELLHETAFYKFGPTSYQRVREHVKEHVEKIDFKNHTGVVWPTIPVDRLGRGTGGYSELRH